MGKEADDSCPQNLLPLQSQILSSFPSLFRMLSHSQNSAQVCFAVNDDWCPYDEANAIEVLPANTEAGTVGCDQQVFVLYPLQGLAAHCIANGNIRRFLAETAWAPRLSVEVYASQLDCFHMYFLPKIVVLQASYADFAAFILCETR